MKISRMGVEFIAEFEGFRARPYRDASGFPTIGCGTAYYPDGTAVRMSDPSITRERGLELLRAVANRFARMVARMVKPGVRLTQGQMDAIISFTYNLGPGSFANSTIRTRINSKAGPDSVTRDMFTRWNKARNPRTGRLAPVAGLTRRRNREYDMFAE